MSDRKTTTKRVYRLISLGVLLIALVCFVVLLSKSDWKTSAASGAKVSQHAPNVASGRTRIEGELIVLRPSGFQPREIRRPAGRPFLLIVENQSPLPVVPLTITGNLELPVRDISITREKRMWSDIVELPRGNYTLREANHPDWVCNITVE